MPPHSPLDDMTLHINRYDFVIPSRYTEGHILTAGEARALNQLMMENIRNNVAPWVRAAERASPEPLLDLEAHEALQARITEYAAEYQFTSRNRQVPVSAITAAISEIATIQAETEGNLQGYAPDSPEVQLRYRQLLNDPKIRNAARQVIAERRRTTVASLEDILGDLP